MPVSLARRTTHVLDLDAAIIPGRGAAGIVLGAPASDLELGRASRTQLHAGVSVYDLGPVLVWTRNGVVDQIGVRAPYAGSIATKGIRIGSTLREVAGACGPVFEDDEDTLVVEGMPGICFETEQWRGGPGCETVDENLDAKITEIFVFSP
jgi:hypothetical protein